MVNPDADVTKARFNFLQAVMVAAITGLVTIASTLITTRGGSLGWPRRR